MLTISLSNERPSLKDGDRPSLGRYVEEINARSVISQSVKAGQKKNARSADALCASAGSEHFSDL
jgi:hypothetical protein